MRLAAFDSSLTRSLVMRAWSTAPLAMRADSCTWRLISFTEDDSSSVAEATDCTLVEASSDAAATTVVSSCARSAVAVSVEAEASSSVDAEDTVSTISPTAPSNWSASLTISALRCCAAISSCRCLASASSRAFCSETTLNFSTAPATWPSSSLRPRPGNTTEKFPPASSSIALLSERIGRPMVKKENAQVPTRSSMVKAATISDMRSADAISRAASALLPSSRSVSAGVPRLVISSSQARTSRSPMCRKEVRSPTAT